MTHTIDVNNRQGSPNSRDSVGAKPHSNNTANNIYKITVSDQAQSAEKPEGLIHRTITEITSKKTLLKVMRRVVALLALAAIVTICIFAPHFAAFTVLIFFLMGFSVAPDLIKIKSAFKPEKPLILTGKREKVPQRPSNAPPRIKKYAEISPPPKKCRFLENGKAEFLKRNPVQTGLKQTK